MRKKLDTKILAPLFLAVTLLLGTIVGSLQPTQSVKAAKATDPWDNPTMTLGSSLSKKQKKGTINVLQDQIHGHDFQELTVNGDTLVKYLNPSGAHFTSDSKVYSSALIEHKKTGGINVEIIKYNDKNNITSITANEYKNAALTAGIKDANIYVTSAVKIDGSGALAGIYAAYDKNGKGLDQDRINAAQDELNILSDINQANEDKDGYTDDQLTNAIAGAKYDMAKEGGDLSRSQITSILNNQLNENNLTSVITSSQKKRLINLLVEIQKSGATTSDGFKGQAKKVSHSISNPVAKTTNKAKGETTAKKNEQDSSKPATSESDQYKKDKEDESNHQGTQSNQTTNTSQNKNIFQQMWDGIVSFFSNIGNQISNWINGNNNNDNNKKKKKNNNSESDTNSNSDTTTPKKHHNSNTDNSTSSDSSDSSTDNSSSSDSSSSSSDNSSNSNNNSNSSNNNSNSGSTSNNSQVQSQSN